MRRPQLEPFAGSLPSPVRWLCLAWTFASLSDWFVLWAVVWSAGLEGWSGAQTAGIIVAARAPALLGGVAGGLAVDRFGPRRMMLVDGVSRTGAMLGLVASGLFGGLGYGTALVLVAVAGATAPVSYSAVRTFLPRLVPVADLGRANTLLAVGNALPLVLSAGIVGPALDQLGLSRAFLVPAALMAGVVLITLWLPNPASSGRSTPALGLPVGGEGLVPRQGRGPQPRPPRSIPAVTIALLGLSTVYFATFGPFDVVLPLVVREQLDAGAQTFGVLWTVVGVGALGGLFLAPSLCRLPRPGVVNAGLAIVNGLIMIPLAYASSIEVALIACLGIGLLWTPYSAVEATALQRFTPAHHHGKVFGAQRALVISALPVGAAIGALAQERFGPSLALAGSGLAAIAFGLCALAIPAIRSRVPDDRTPAEGSSVVEHGSAVRPS